MADSPVEISSIEELTGYLREEVNAGNLPNTLNLLEVAKELEGEEAAQQVYTDIVRPGLDARLKAFKHGNLELTEDEMRLTAAIFVENGSREAFLACADALEQGADYELADLFRALSAGHAAVSRPCRRGDSHDPG